MKFDNQNEERKVITAEEFLKLITENAMLKGYQVNENLLLDGTMLQKSITHITFHQCHFCFVRLKNIGNQIQIAFTNCTIQNLLISDLAKKSNDVQSPLFKLSIHDSEIGKISCFNHPSIELDFSNSLMGEFYTNDCYFPAFNCMGVLFKSDIDIEDCTIDFLRLVNCRFDSYFNIHKSSFITDLLYFIECHFKEQFIFALKERTTAVSKLKINIQSCQTDDRMVFNGKLSDIEKLTVYKQKGHLIINDLNILTIEIQGAHERNATYRFGCCSFNQFRCIGISSSVHFSTIKSFGNQSVFIIRGSDLNNASLFDVNLKSFDSVIIEKSDITNMTTSRVTWFEDKKLKTAFQSENEDPYERREFYRQLKYNQEKQGNKIQALTFQSLEMQYYSQELNPKNVVANFLLKNRYLAFLGHFILAFTSQNRFILWIGKSNNHGQSFLKPLLLLVVLGLIFNFLILQSASPQSTMELLFKKGNLKMLPSLLNPVHDISKLLHVEEPSFLTNMLDLTWKVIEATLIFQTITAFRKHVRV